MTRFPYHLSPTPSLHSLRGHPLLDHLRHTLRIIPPPSPPLPPLFLHLPTCAIPPLFLGHCLLDHLRLSSLQRQWIQDAFLLAAAMGRTLVLPQIWCVADRFWTILNHCLIGSKVEMPQPFVCPLDHSYNLPLLHQSGLDWREHSFLSNPRVPPEVASSRMRLRVAPSDGAASAQPRGGTSEPELTIPAGSDFAQLARAVRESQSASEVRNRAGGRARGRAKVRLRARAG